VNHKPFADVRAHDTVVKEGNMKKILLSFVVVVFIFMNCATSLQYLSINHSISKYKIYSVAVLPFQTALQIPGINEMADIIFFERLNKSALYADVVPPDRIKELMADERVSNSVNSLRDSLDTVITADPKTTQWLCSGLKTDALIIGDITQWSKDSASGSDTFKAELNVRIVSKDGKVLWHGTDSESYTPQYNDWDLVRKRITDDSAFNKALGEIVDKMLANFPGTGK
jgi:hypothetical protein